VCAHVHACVHALVFFYSTDHKRQAAAPADMQDPHLRHMLLHPDFPPPHPKPQSNALRSAGSLPPHEPAYQLPICSTSLAQAASLHWPCHLTLCMCAHVPMCLLQLGCMLASNHATTRLTQGPTARVWEKQQEWCAHTCQRACTPQLALTSSHAHARTHLNTSGR